MIKGLAITPPILGRISIGRMIEKNGKRLPEKDDQFTITSQIQGKDGWVKHPLDEQLRSQAPNQKLRSIPVRMIFNDPELNLRAEYSLFDRQTGRPICVGNGQTCQRMTSQGVEQHPCPSPDLCPLGQGGHCKPYGRLHVRDGIHLQEAIQTAKEIDQKSKLCGFNQAALDQMARQGYGNARFEVNAEEGLDLVEEFYNDKGSESESVQTEIKNKSKSELKSHQGEGVVQEIQKSLKQNVRIVN